MPAAISLGLVPYLYRWNDLENQLIIIPITLSAIAFAAALHVLHWQCAGYRQQNPDLRRATIAAANNKSLHGGTTPACSHPMISSGAERHPILLVRKQQYKHAQTVQSTFH